MSSTLELDMSIMFDADDALREYAETDGREPEADGRIRIGYVYATIRFESFLHPGYASVECWAATSGMSRLFARSTNIRKVFTDVTAASCGVCCLFDTGDGGIRMSDEELTVAELKDRLRDDTSITDQHERCGLYAQVFRYTNFDKSEYLNLGAGGCAAYDPASFQTF